MIAIVDLELGNLRSVENALLTLGYDPIITRDESVVREASHVILPGVGQFRAARAELDRSNLEGSIVERAKAGTPILGICLGMQLLGTVGEEGGETPGLDLIGGRIVRFDGAKVPRVPHVGWNEVRARAAGHPLLARLKDGVDFYFVHSYHFVPDDDAEVIATTEYGGHDYVAVVGKGNVFGAQFHPEKSQANGLRLLENFCELGAC